MYNLDKDKKYHRFAMGVIDFMKKHNIEEFTLDFSEVKNGDIGNWKTLKISIGPMVKNNF